MRFLAPSGAFRSRAAEPFPEPDLQAEAERPIAPTTWAEALFSGSPPSETLDRKIEPRASYRVRIPGSNPDAVPPGATQYLSPDSGTSRSVSSRLLERSGRVPGLSWSELREHVLN